MLGRVQMRAATRNRSSVGRDIASMAVSREHGDEHESALAIAARGFVGGGSPRGYLELFDPVVDRSSLVLLSLDCVRIHEMDRRTRHDSRDRMLIHELRVTIAAQENTKIVEPSDDPLQLHAVDEKDRKGRFVLPDVV